VSVEYRKLALRLPTSPLFVNRKIKVLVNGRHAASNTEGTQLTGLIRCFPAAHIVDVSWQSTVADTNDKLNPASEPIADLAHVHTFVIRMDLRQLEPARDYLPQELSMLFAHLRLPGVTSLTAMIYDMLGDASMDNRFDDLSNALSTMDFPALQVFNLEVDFNVEGLPIGDAWVSSPFVIPLFRPVTAIQSYRAVLSDSSTDCYRWRP
jgi:hypothetical protein